MKNVRKIVAEIMTQMDWDLTTKPNPKFKRVDNVPVSKTPANDQIKLFTDDLIDNIEPIDLIVLKPMPTGLKADFGTFTEL